MTNVTFDERMQAARARRGAGKRDSRSFVARALLGNVALLSGLLVMPLLILVGYLVQGHM